MTKSMTCSYCGASDTILCKQPHGYSSVTLADKKMAFNVKLFTTKSASLVALWSAPLSMNLKNCRKSKNP